MIIYLMLLVNTELGNEGLYTFSENITPKKNIIVQLEFKQAYYDVTVQLVSQYALRAPQLFYKERVY